MIPYYDIEHSLMREAQEQAAAGAATNIAAREVHLDLAGRYADRAWGDRERRCVDGDRC